MNQQGHTDPPPSYQEYTDAMNELATTIAAWHRVT
jgi:hypothetical protein